MSGLGGRGIVLHAASAYMPTMQEKRGPALALGAIAVAEADDRRSCPERVPDGCAHGVPAGAGAAAKH